MNVTKPTCNNESRRSSLFLNIVVDACREAGLDTRMFDVGSERPSLSVATDDRNSNRTLVKLHYSGMHQVCDDNSLEDTILVDTPLAAFTAILGLCLGVDYDDLARAMRWAAAVERDYPR